MTNQADNSVTTIEEMIARLPSRLKNGGWTDADVEAARSGYMSFEQLCDQPARLRLCTFAGYFDRTLIVRGPESLERIPVFRVVSLNAATSFGYDFGSLSKVRIDNEDDVPTVLKVSADYIAHEHYRTRFSPSAGESATTLNANGPIEFTNMKGWTVLTEAGLVSVIAGSPADVRVAARDGVMKFLETPDVLQQLKR